MTRTEFREFMTTTFDEILALFNDRNGSYGSGEDAHHNFFETGRRITPLLTRVAEEYKQTGTVSPGLAAYVSWFCLQDKHQVALAKGPGVSEGSQRIMDEIVYNLLALPWFLDAELQNEHTLTKEELVKLRGAEVRREIEIQHAADNRRLLGLKEV